ncbi:hypothetical protein Vretifemale_15293 [Volvox reticuliferus]|uniref:Uncharacterized protein n=1 Tax=Volvox reticuliferus TaxID=1737510 RepID=A0A8J4CTC6_9CHLO|nr:hypothetical protein Vretifemale_15293 [Volvox reticuliferus]
MAAVSRLGPLLGALRWDLRLAGLGGPLPPPSPPPTPPSPPSPPSPPPPSPAASMLKIASSLQRREVDVRGTLGNAAEMAAGEPVPLLLRGGSHVRSSWCARTAEGSGNNNEGREKGKKGRV